MLKINLKTHLDLDKWKDSSAVPYPSDYTFIYRSPRVAFDNIWDLWMDKRRNVAVIAVQGSIQTDASFLANLYAAMVPAKGDLQLEKDFNFSYHLSDHPQAAVHVGWLVALGYLSTSIVHQMDSCISAGVKDFIITGHSQGGGIAFLLTSYLANLQLEGRFPKDIQFKTYCSAGPKPGNLFYSRGYDFRTAGGWAYNVVNTADWVPDVPFTVQTVDDFTAVNPFRHAKAVIRKQKFPRNIALRHVYNQLSRPSKRAQKRYQKYLGRMISRSVTKQLPDFSVPAYYQSSYYVPAGTTIVLAPDEAYYKVYSNDPGNPNIWQHHLPKPYLDLAERVLK